MPWVSQKRLDEIDNAIATLGGMCDFACGVAKDSSLLETRVMALEKMQQAILDGLTVALAPKNER